MYPYEPQPEIVLQCETCKADIYPERNEEYLEINGKIYCLICRDTIYIQNRIKLNQEMREIWD